MPIVDINGNIVDDGGGSSDFNVSDYSVFDDGTKEKARQAVLIYKGKKLYPKNMQEQRIDVVKNYNGGVMLTLGDSYTAYMNSFFEEFATKHGLVQDNQGLASSTIAGFPADSIGQDGQIGYKPFWGRLDKDIAEYETGKVIKGKTYQFADVKLITFMGGANDWSTVDKTTDRLGKGANETDKAKLYGALNYIFTKLLEKFPNADIVVILQPLNYASKVPSSEETAKSLGFENLAQVQKMTDAEFSCYMMARKEVIVREMAERYSLHICDCCFDWFNPINMIDAKKYWQPDKLHLSTEGHQKIIDKLEKTVDNL